MAHPRPAGGLLDGNLYMHFRVRTILFNESLFKNRLGRSVSSDNDPNSSASNRCAALPLEIISSVGGACIRGTGSAGVDLWDERSHGEIMYIQGRVDGSREMHFVRPCFPWLMRHWLLIMPVE